MEQKIKKEVKEATEYTLKSPEPDAKDVQKYLYV